VLKSSISRLHIPAEAAETQRGTFDVSFSPAASDKALKAIRQMVRGWTLYERSTVR
jgi:hypothetical protein